MKLVWLLTVLLASHAAWSQQTSNRAALIIGIGQYSEASNTPPLDGVPVDMLNARRMAKEMGIPNDNIVELRDSQATKANIQKAFESLAKKVKEGDRVFIYHSGHGTRYQEGNSCLQGLQTYTAGKFTVADILTEAEIASYTKPISEKADKVVMMIDACFSGGVINPSTRSLSDRLNIRPKFNGNSSQSCENVGVNKVNTRSLLSEIKRFGIHEENFVQIAAANNNEVSWDTKELGGMATHTMSQCLTGEAADLNGSGAISLDEVRACAQIKLNDLMKPHEKLGYFPSTIQINGNRNLIPTAVKPPPVMVAQIPSIQTPAVQAPVLISDTQKLPSENAPAFVKPIIEPVKPPASNQPVTRPVTPPASPQVTPPNVAIQTQSEPVNAQIDKPHSALPVKPVVNQVGQPHTTKPLDAIKVVDVPKIEPALASLSTLKDIEQQRNPKRVVDVKVSKPVMKIGKDSLDLSIKSSHDGFVYLILLGSDSKSFYVLYPNGLDKENAIKAGQTLRIPKPDWEVKANGPVGTNNLLVLVSDSPRKLDDLSMAEPTSVQPFTFALNDIGGRAALIHFLTSSGGQGNSESFGAKLMAVKEVK